MSPRRKPTVTVHHCANSWVAPDYSDLADCTLNYHRSLNGQLPCTGTVVWKVVEQHDLHMTTSFYCDADLPAKHRPRKERRPADNCPDCQRQVQPVAEYRSNTQVSHLYRCACGHVWSTNRDLGAYGEAA